MAVRILVVDDESDLRLLITQRFRSQIAEGLYEFSFAGDGAEALEALERLESASRAATVPDEPQSLIPEADEGLRSHILADEYLPEILFTDLNMPRMGGLELIERVRSLYPFMVVIVVSAYDDLANIRTAMFGGASDFIVKPIDFPELELTIEKARMRHLETLEYNRRLHENSVSLKRTLGMTLEAISMIGEIRDPYTAGHQKRVASLTKALARELRLSADQTDGAFVAATLHDIGKIYVPAEILAKPGKLTGAEYSLIKEHARLGYEILKTIEFPWPVAEIVYQRHEHIDGTGYPRALKGDEIMPEARLLTVADFVEAVSSHRPYRVALGSKVAIADIIKESGRAFDPLIVRACVDLFERGEFSFDAQD